MVGQADLSTCTQVTVFFPLEVWLGSKKLMIVKRGIKIQNLFNVCMHVVYLLSQKRLYGHIQMAYHLFPLCDRYHFQFCYVLGQTIHQECKIALYIQWSCHWVERVEPTAQQCTNQSHWMEARELYEWSIKDQTNEGYNRKICSESCKV